MEKVAEYLNIALAWLNNPMVKTGMLMVGGWLWKNHSGTVNRAYPMVALVASAMLTASRVLSQLLENIGTQPAALSAAGVTGDSLVAVVMSVVVPVVAAVGTHSWWKNVLQWMADGYRIRKQS